MATNGRQISMTSNRRLELLNPGSGTVQPSKIARKLERNTETQLTRRGSSAYGTESLMRALESIRTKDKDTHPDPS
jgi:hypothetical protein